MKGITYFSWQQEVEVKTGNTSAACNGKTCSRTGTLNNETWSSWITAPAGILVGEQLNNLSLSVGGSGISAIEVEMTYTAARPTPVKTAKIQLSSGPLSLPLCSRKIYDSR